MLPEYKLAAHPSRSLQMLEEEKATKCQIHLRWASTKVRDPPPPDCSQGRRASFLYKVGKGISIGPCWWHTFLARWNGLSLLCSIHSLISPDVIIQMNASGVWGFSACLSVISVPMAMPIRLCTYVNYS